MNTYSFLELINPNFNSVIFRYIIKFYFLYKISYTLQNCFYIAIKFYLHIYLWCIFINL